MRLQALAEGSLSERARRRAEKIANDADLRISISRDPIKPGLIEVRERWVSGGLQLQRDPRLPLPGALLAREFRGCDIVGKALDTGFEYDGRWFKSLPAVALEATGRANGMASSFAGWMNPRERRIKTARRMGGTEEKTIRKKRYFSPPVCGEPPGDGWRNKEKLAGNSCFLSVPIHCPIISPQSF